MSGGSSVFSLHEFPSIIFYLAKKGTVPLNCIATISGSSSVHSLEKPRQSLMFLPKKGTVQYPCRITPSSHSHSRSHSPKKVQWIAHLETVPEVRSGTVRLERAFQRNLAQIHAGLIRGTFPIAFVPHRDRRTHTQKTKAGQRNEAASGRVDGPAHGETNAVTKKHKCVYT